VFNKLTPNLMVESIEEALEFYRDVLGFNVVHTVPGDDSLNFAILNQGNVEMMLQARKSMKEDVPQVAEQSGSPTLILYVDVNGIEDFHARIRDSVDVVVPMRKTFYGMNEFYIRDPFGFFFGFAEKADS